MATHSAASSSGACTLLDVAITFATQYSAYSKRFFFETIYQFINEYEFTHDIMDSSVHESLEYCDACDVCDDCDTRDHQNPAFDAQKFESNFQRIFKSQPRNIQTVVARWMHEKPSKGVLVAEVPTGGGKTRIGVYKIMQALQDGFKRGIYACATKSLQFQIANDAKKWNVGSVVCLYGKANYWCDDRLQRYLESTQDPQTVAVLNAIKDVDIGLLPPKDLFENACKRCKLWNGAKIRDIWESINAEKCECYSKMWKRLKDQNVECIKETMLRDLKCHHGLQRLRAEKASVFVINMSLFLTYARCGVMLKPDDYLCIDEAHELSKWASSCFEDCLPDTLDVKEVNAFLTRCGAPSPFSVESIRAGRFPSHDSLLFCNEVSNYIKSIKSNLDLQDLTDLVRLTEGALKLGRQLEQLVFDNQSWSTDKVLVQLGTFDIDADLYEYFCNRVKGVELDGDRSEWLRMARGVLEENVNTFSSEVKSRDEAFAVAKRLCGTECLCKELLDSLREVRQMCDIMQVATFASDIAWTTSEQKSMIPLACKSGVRYVASSQFIADKMKSCIWGSVKGVLLMSATMTSCDQTDKPFAIFCNEVGLDETNAFTHAFPEVFDKSNINVCAPFIGKYNAMNYNKRKEFINNQVDVINEYLNALSPGKSALVISPSLTEINELQSHLARKRKKQRHIMFSNRVEFDQFVQSPSTSAIIYGSDGLSTGVDLPGRVGLVVITRPWNPIPDQVKQLYERTYLGVSNDSYWKYYRYRRDRKEFQAAGRLQRCEADHGTILFLGEPIENNHESSANRLLHKWRVDRHIDRPNKLRKIM